MDSAIDGSDPHRNAVYGDEEVVGSGYVKKPRSQHKPNPWLQHVKKYREDHPGLSYKECLKRASAERRGARGSKSAAARRQANTEYE